MILNKIIGYILLVLGLIIVFFTLYQSYNIFNDKISAPIIFKTQITQQKSKANNQLNLQEQMQEQVQKVINSQISELLPIDTLPKILNLFSWSILAGILIFGGGQIAIIGIKLIK